MLSLGPMDVKEESEELGADEKHQYYSLTEEKKKTILSAIFC